MRRTIPKPDNRMRDYSLTGPESARAQAQGLVDGDWFRSPVDPEVMRQLTERTNGRAVADLVLWLSMIVGSGVAAVASIGNWWAVPLFATYGAVAVGGADARWHEFGHGTAAAGLASGMAERGRWFLLLPRGVVPPGSA